MHCFNLILLRVTWKPQLQGMWAMIAHVFQRAWHFTRLSSFNIYNFRREFSLFLPCREKKRNRGPDSGSHEPKATHHEVSRAKTRKSTHLFSPFPSHFSTMKGSHTPVNSHCTVKHIFVLHTNILFYHNHLQRKLWFALLLLGVGFSFSVIHTSSKQKRTENVFFNYYRVSKHI